MLRHYYSLAKPGIVYGNAVSAIAGFFLAARGEPNLTLLVVMLGGLSLVIASGCVFNNYLDRDIDARMERTRDRALVRGDIRLGAALIFGTMLGVIGFAVLAFFTNALAALVALVGFLVYVVAYSGWAKRATPYATHLGSIAGATPPVVGYVAVTGSLDLGAFILFLILVFWQMPHFFAIAIRRIRDYAAAGIPALPLTNGIRAAKVQIVLYIIAFGVAAVALALFGYAGTTYLVGAVVLSVGWLVVAIAALRGAGDTQSARKVFVASLIVLTVLCVLMATDATRAAPRYLPTFVLSASGAAR